MVDVTYNAKPGDPVHTSWHGIRFEHGKPTSVPADHPILRKDDRTGQSLVDGSDWFFLAGAKPKADGKPEEPKTVAAYFAYASAWIAAATQSGALKSRWDRESEMRERLGWSSEDADRMEDIMKPKFQALRKAENEVK